MQARGPQVGQTLPPRAGDHCSDRYSTLRRFRLGATGFEPATSCSQSRRATGLRHAPRFAEDNPAVVGCKRPLSARAVTKASQEARLSSAGRNQRRLFSTGTERQPPMCRPTSRIVRGAPDRPLCFSPVIGGSVPSPISRGSVISLKLVNPKRLGAHADRSPAGGWPPRDTPSRPACQPVEESWFSCVARLPAGANRLYPRQGGTR